MPRFSVPCTQNQSILGVCTWNRFFLPHRHEFLQNILASVSTFCFRIFGIIDTWQLSGVRNSWHFYSRNFDWVALERKGKCLGVTISNSMVNEKNFRQSSVFLEWEKNLRSWFVSKSKQTSLQSWLLYCSKQITTAACKRVARLFKQDK